MPAVIYAWAFLIAAIVAAVVTFVAIDRAQRPPLPEPLSRIARVQ